MKHIEKVSGVVDEITEGITLEHLIDQWFWLVVKLVVMYLLLLVGVYVVRRLFLRAIKRREAQGADRTNIIFMRNVVVYTLYTIGFASMMNQIPALQKLSTALLAGAGILAAAVGFGSQQALSNIISGVFMVIFKPFRIGDAITLSPDYAGVVTDISMRHTTIRNAEGRMIVVPNSVLNNQVIINSSLHEAPTCAFVEVGIGYSANIDRAMNIIREEALKHPLCIDNRSEADKLANTPQVAVRVIALADSSVNLRAWVWGKSSGDAFVMKCDLLKSIKERFDKEGIEIPFPYRNMIVQQPGSAMPAKA